VNIPNIQAALLADHPETGAYNADDALAADQMNEKNIERNKTSMSGRELADNIVNAEYVPLTDAKKSQLLALVGATNIDPFGLAAHVIIDVFEVGAQTIINLQAARKEIVSHATIIEAGGFVYRGHIEAARAL